MKKLLFTSFVALFLFSCGGSTMRTIYGTTDKNLIKTVSMEQNCPEENVKITDNDKGLGRGTYVLDVCGKRMIYKNIGGVFMEQSAADKMLSN